MRWTAVVLVGLVVSAGVADSLTAKIDPSMGRRAISPLIFGVNHDYPGPKDGTIRRWGGNSTENYNWETNNNNSGTDWQQDSGSWLNRYTPDGQKSSPAAAIVTWHRESLRRGVPSIVNIPTLGWVAADGSGPVSEAEAAPSKRWKRVVPLKGKPFSLQPDPSDDVVYTDELINFLTHTFGRSDSKNGIAYYAVGNEPGLWSHTHPRIQREKVSCREHIDRAITTAIAIKRVDPTAKIIGPSGFGVYEMVGFVDAPDWPEVKKAGGYRWYMDFVLDEFAKASKKEGKRLLDVVNFHYYTEGEIIEHGGALGVMNAHRTLRDSGFREASWISEILTEHLPVLPNLKRSIAQYYPGTLIGVTEYERAMPDKVFGGIAMGDLLATFIEEDLHLATAWPLSGFDQENPAPYFVAGRQLFLNFDGQGGRYGDIRVDCMGDNADRAPVYASVDSKTGRLHVVVFNKNLHATLTTKLEIVGNWTAVAAFGFDESSPELKSRALPVKGGTGFETATPRRSAMHYVFRPN